MNSSSSLCDSSGNKETKTRKKSMISAVKLSTDPQSVAARQRRHRISQRFKILQSLIPGGSKMDTASMLDEAINYVKFLKAQICLHQTMVSSFEINADNPTKYLTYESFEENTCQVVDLYNYYYCGDHVPNCYVQAEENVPVGF